MFYSQALQGRFFSNQQTLEQFRRILSLGDITYLVPFPLAPVCLAKPAFDSPGQHARCIAGGMYFPDRWVYFVVILNWNAADVHDPATASAYFDALRKAIALLEDRLGR